MTRMIMKWLARSLCALVLVGWVSERVQAQDVRLGYIDSAVIFEQYDEAQEAQQRFDRQVVNWRTEAQEIEKLVEELRAELRDQGPILSALKRQEKEEELQRAASDYERFVQEIWGPGGRAEKENEQATGLVVTEIRKVVEQLANERNLNLVLDAAGGFIVYADRSLDLTPLVIEELNNQAAGAR